MNSRIALIFDWDQTVTQAGGASNEEATHFGLDYITAAPETISQRYMLPGFAATLISALDNGCMVMIGTSQPHKQIIRHALISLLGERANDIVITSANPEKLCYVFRIPNPRLAVAERDIFAGKSDQDLVLVVPLHTKDIRNVIAEMERDSSAKIRELLVATVADKPAVFKRKWSSLNQKLQQQLNEKCVIQGMDEHWENCYKKLVWNASDVAPVAALMDSLGKENIGILESEKEEYIWKALKANFSEPVVSCERIIYVDDSLTRLTRLRDTIPPEFKSIPLDTFIARPNTNDHFINVLEQMGKSRDVLTSHIDALSISEARWLVKQLASVPVRLKKSSEVRPSLHTFFVAGSKLKILMETVVKLDANRFMVIGHAPEAAGIGLNSKVKRQITYRYAEDKLSFEMEREELVKIHLCRNFRVRDVDGLWPIVRRSFIEKVKNEAALFVRYNDLTEQDVSLVINEVEKGLRIYMAMPSLGVALCNDKFSSWDLATRLSVFFQVFERVELIHRGGDAHFDLTLNNILYDEKTRSVHICDFGLAQAAGTKLTVAANRTIDPPKYSDATDDAIHYSTAYDIFSLGVSLALYLGFEMRSQDVLEKSVFARGALSDSGAGYEDSAVVSSPTGYDGNVKLASSATLSAGTGYTGVDQLFDFTTNPQPEAQAVIELLRLMMHPDPRQRPSAQQCKVYLEGLGVNTRIEPTLSSVGFGLNA